MILKSTQPGYWEFQPVVDPTKSSYMHYNCPCGCGSVGMVKVVQPLKAARDNNTWGWDGNAERPTLVPSLRRLVACKFHGLLIDGAWLSCADSVPLHYRVYGASTQPVSC